MFLEIEGGTCEDVAGLKCWLPPEGYLWDYEQGKWHHDGVHKHSRLYEDCFWKRDPRFFQKTRDSKLPLYLEWKAEEDARKKQDPGFVHAELAKFTADCWRWRLSGYWFYNNNKATYITGIHWYYLTCYWMKKQYPDYRDVDRHFFYAWDYVVEDPVAYGLLLVTKRRMGKSYMGGCLGVEKISRTQSALGGIQSKTDKDARTLYERAFIEPFRKLPYFFRPVTNLKADQKPAAVLRFETGSMETGLNIELNSRIDYRSSKANAYDSEELIYYLDDEFGKCEEEDVFDRWSVARFCLLNHKQEVVGKALHITTVEEMEGGGSNAKKLWDASDQNQRDAYGQTASGCYRMFIPAHYAGEPDKYGFANTEREMQKIISQRALQLDPRALSALKRKMPLDEREAFSADATTCAFSNIQGLTDQHDILKALPEQYKAGNFAWVDGVPDTTVEFVPTPTGKFLIAWMPDEQYRNLKRERFNEWHPMNTDMACGGCDPYNHRILTKEGERTMSYGAIIFIKRPNPLSPHEGLDEGPCLLYRNRPAAPEIFYEDCLMAAIFYGCQVLIENNKDKCLDWFIDRGYGGYLAWMPNAKTPGINNNAPTTGTGVNGLIANLTDSYITHYIETCYYPQLIEEWLDFDVTKTTKFDVAMAFGFAKILQKTLGNTGMQRPPGTKAPAIEETLPSAMYSGGGRGFFD